MIELEKTRRPTTSSASIASEAARVLIPVLILALGAFVLWGSAKLRKKPTVVPEPEPSLLVKIAHPHPLSEGLTFTESGSVVPFRELTLAAEVAGRVVNKADVCRAGRFVKAGTVLLTIDPQDYVLETKRLQQEVQQAEVNLSEADVELDNIKALITLAEQERGLQEREVERLESLVVGRAAAPSELDRARSSELLANNALQLLQNRTRMTTKRQESLRAALDLARTRLEKAQLDLKRTEIGAPCDGVITAEMVEQDSFVTRGTTLVKLEDTSSVEVRCNLRSDYLAWLWRAENRIGWGGDATSPGERIEAQFEIPRLPATISLTSGGERYEWDAVLSRYEGFGLDEETRTVPCRVLVRDPMGGRHVTTGSPAPALVRGMFVDVAIHVDPDKELLVIPTSALRLGDVVWVVQEGTLVGRSVKVVRKHENQVVVESGPAISSGDQIVVSPLAGAYDGMKVSTET